MLRISLGNLFRRPFTTTYPKGQADLPKGNRGRVMWDMERCIFCRRCERSCPTNAIHTDKVAGTQTVMRNRCIACNTCVEVCPTQTISMAMEYSAPATAPQAHRFSVELPRHQYEEVPPPGVPPQEEG